MQHSENAEAVAAEDFAAVAEVTAAGSVVVAEVSVACIAMPATKSVAF